MAVYRLRSEIQPYSWGSKKAIAEFFGRTPSGGPEAELWMGAHPKCPSRVVGGPEPDLSKLLERFPQELLGPKIADEYGGLPFLFKVLAADAPLSLQAHPSKEQAARGFEREEQLGIDRLAPNRNYRDRSDKPELICALQPFSALCGFRSPSEVLGLLEEMCRLGAREEIEWFFAPFLETPSEAGYRAVLERSFSLSTERLRVGIDRVRDLVTRVPREDGSLSSPLRDYSPWLVRLADHYPEDPGVFTSLLLNYVELAPGQAMFLPAGNFHAYLSGIGLEVMANSDNVLRGGLTPKHVDPKELCDVLRFESYSPPITRGEAFAFGAGQATRYAVPSPEFSLQIIAPEGESLKVEGPAIGIVLGGTVEVDGEPFARGEQVFIGFEGGAVLGGSGRIAIADVPALWA